MVGGDEDHFEVAREILQHMGKNVMHTGAVGTGQVMPIYLIQCKIACMEQIKGGASIEYPTISEVTHFFPKATLTQNLFDKSLPIYWPPKRCLLHIKDIRLPWFQRP